MESLNFLIGIASLLLSIWAWRKAIVANVAVARFRDQRARLDLTVQLESTIDMLPRLYNARSGRIAKGDWDQLRRLLVRIRSSPVISNLDQRGIELAIAQIRNEAENVDKARVILKNIEERLVAISAKVQHDMEQSL